MDLDPKIEYSRLEGDWHHERISLTSDVPDERIVVHLYLPSSGTPPYQSIVFFPTLIDFYPGDSELQPFDESILGWIPRSGRALVRIVFHGSLERYSGINEDSPEQRSIRHEILMYNFEEDWGALA